MGWAQGPQPILTGLLEMGECDNGVGAFQTQDEANGCPFCAWLLPSSGRLIQALPIRNLHHLTGLLHGPVPGQLTL